MRLDVLSRTHTPCQVTFASDLPDFRKDGVALACEVYLGVLRHRLACLGKESIEVEDQSVDLRGALRCHCKLEWC